MRRSFRIANVFGIPVQVHWSFGLLFLFVIYVGKSRDASWANIGVMGLFVLALFFCVVLHEFGHALSAKYYGVRTRDITILPIGGVARLDNLPEKPFQEFVVAIAGPAVNVVIYVLLALFLHFRYAVDFRVGELLSSNSDEIITNPYVGFLATLLQANLMLVVFNMVPAFPMDGGRVLRALLSMTSLGRTKATKTAAILGQVIAVFFFFFGLLPLISSYLPENEMFYKFQIWVDWLMSQPGVKLFSGPTLTLISGFVFYSARSEYNQVRLEEKLNSFKAAELVRTEFTRLQTIDPINNAIQELTKGNETHFLVFDDTHILRGVLLEEDILDALKNRHYDAMVSSYTTFNFEYISLDATLKEVYDKLYRTNQSILPVFAQNTEGGNSENILGVIDMVTFEKFMENKKIP